MSGMVINLFKLNLSHFSLERYGSAAELVSGMVRESVGRFRLPQNWCELTRPSHHMVRELGKRKSAEVFTKSEKVRESNERKLRSAESWDKSVRIVAPAGSFRVLNCEGLSGFNRRLNPERPSAAD